MALIDWSKATPEMLEQLSDQLRRAFMSQLEMDIDTMHDVYMTRAQREAYNRIVAKAKQA